MYLKRFLVKRLFVRAVIQSHSQHKAGNGARIPTRRVDTGIMVVM